MLNPAKTLFWELAIIRKRIECAMRQRRFEDASRLTKLQESVEYQARRLLKSKGHI